MCRDQEVGIGGEDAEMVEVICCTAVVAVRVLEFSKVVESGDLIECELER